MDEVRILLLEASSSHRDLIRHELSLLGWTDVRCEAARPGFIEALSSFDPSLVLADHGLAGFTAEKALRLARKKDPDVPFILITGAAEEEDAARVRRPAADDYLPR